VLVRDDGDDCDYDAGNMMLTFISIMVSINVLSFLNKGVQLLCQNLPSMVSRLLLFRRSNRKS